MRIERSDGMVVAAVAVASAVLLGVGGPLLEADGSTPVKAPPLSPDGAQVAQLGGCDLVAKAEATREPGKHETVVTIRASNAGSAGAELHLIVAAERRELKPEAAMRRVISDESFVTTRVGEKDLRLAVPGGAAAEGSVRFTLPAGTYTIAASLAGDATKTVSLCMLAVPSPEADGKAGS